MKHLKDYEDDTVNMVIIECDCGFHLGLDNTYIDQVGDITLPCPSCNETINTLSIMPDDDLNQDTLKFSFLSDHFNLKPENIVKDENSENDFYLTFPFSEREVGIECISGDQPTFTKPNYKQCTFLNFMIFWRYI